MYMTLLRDAGLVILSGLLAYFIGTAFGFQFYAFFFPEEAVGSGFFGFGALGGKIIGIVVVFIFVLLFLLETFGSRFKIWWVAIFLLPIAWLVVQTDLWHSWFYALVALVGWGIGFGVRWVFSGRVRIFK